MRSKFCFVNSKNFSYKKSFIVIKILGKNVYIRLCFLKFLKQTSSVVINGFICLNSQFHFNAFFNSSAYFLAPFEAITAYDAASSAATIVATGIPFAAAPAASAVAALTSAAFCSAVAPTASSALAAEAAAVCAAPLTSTPLVAV